MNATKENFITARYIDNNKRQIEVLYNENGETVSHVLTHDHEHPDFKQLIEIISIDDLHSNTVAFIKNSQKDFREHVKRIATAEGMIQEVTAELSTNLYKELYRMFYAYDENEHKEKLFNLKLFIFEKEEVKNSQDTETKAAMRKAATPLEFFNEFKKLKV